MIYLMSIATIFYMELSQASDQDWKFRYKAPEQSHWTGRDDEGRRFYKSVTAIDMTQQMPLKNPSSENFAIIGFASDEGIRRNKGRIGAYEGPQYIRNSLKNKPLHGDIEYTLFDCGDVYCDDGNLEATQEALGDLVSLVLKCEIHPIVIGGGHSLAWGDYQGIEKANLHTKCAIVNIDAHLDLRPLLPGNLGSSGTPFTQIAQRRISQGIGFNYSCLALQETGNTGPLFDAAKSLNVNYVMADEIFAHGYSACNVCIEKVISENNNIYLTICLDAFAQSAAPGVSAPSTLGIFPQHIVPIIKKLVLSNKMVAFDIAEMSPRYDRDNMTSALAAELISKYIRAFADIKNCNNGL